MWFPPAADGERVALATDRGEFRVLGVNQPGNLDRAIFPLPPPAIPPLPPGTAVRVATSPLFEIAAALVAVALMSLSLALRPTATTDGERAADAGEYVDPMIYAVVDRTRRVPVGGITVGMSALAVVATGAHVL